MLLVKAMCFWICGILWLGVCLFGSAGTLAYAGAWRLMGLLFIPMLLVGAALYVKSPALLAKRLNHRERQSGQKAVVALSGVMFIAAFVLAGLDHRFGWTQVPVWLVWAACALLVLGYALYAEVMRENAYLSRTIEVQANQQVVSTGLYGVVRHPMYAATLLLFLSMPLVLGSWVSFAVLLIYPVLIVCRIRGEEQLLRRDLPGYAEYCQQVRWRLIPFVW